MSEEYFREYPKDEFFEYPVCNICGVEIDFQESPICDDCSDSLPVDAE